MWSLDADSDLLQICKQYFGWEKKGGRGKKSNGSLQIYFFTSWLSSSPTPPIPKEIKWREEEGEEKRKKGGGRGGGEGRWRGERGEGKGEEEGREGGGEMLMR